jgi:hypothetical protein
MAPKFKFLFANEDIQITKSTVKDFNVISHQIDANQNHNEISPYTCIIKITDNT